VSAAEPVSSLPAGVHVRPELGTVKLRVYDAASAGPRLAAAFQTTPPAPNTESRIGPLGLAAIGPGEWLLTGPREATAAWIEAIETAFAGETFLVVELTAGRTVLEVSGPTATRLMGLCPADLGPDRFPPGRVARTLVGDIAVMVVRLDEARLRVVLDQTLSGPLLNLLRHGASGARG
jgi:sarcosine oxidase, subunit gamma